MWPQMLIKLHILSEYQVSKLFIIPSKFHFWLKKSFKLDFLRMAKTDLTGFRVAPSKWVAAAKFFTGINFCSYFLKVLTEMLLWCKFQVFWTIFGWFRAHFRSKSGIFPSNFIKGKSRFRCIPILTKTATELPNVIIFTFRKKFWIPE